MGKGVWHGRRYEPAKATGGAREGHAARSKPVAAWSCQRHLLGSLVSLWALVSPRGRAGRGQHGSRSRLQGAPVSGAAGAGARAAADTSGAVARAAGQLGYEGRGSGGPGLAG